MLAHFKKTILISTFLIFSLYATEKHTIKSRYGAGFFAELYAVLYYTVLILFNDPNGKEVYVDWSQEFFPYKNDKHENGWELFFDNIGFVQKVRDISPSEVIHDQTCIKKWLNYDDFLQYRLSINKVLNNYIKIKAIILDEADYYYNSHMSNTTCIGVHVRFSAAHASEKPGPVKLQDYFDEIDTLIKEINGLYKIYIATDSDYVIEQFKIKYPNELLYINAIRSKYMEEVHLIFDDPEYYLKYPEEFHKKKPGYKGGKDVLMECLLLSKCHYLVHTTSNVSDFATFLNPYIKSIFIPKKITACQPLCHVCLAKDKWYASILEIKRYLSAISTNILLK